MGDAGRARVRELFEPGVMCSRIERARLAICSGQNLRSTEATESGAPASVGDRDKLNFAFSFFGGIRPSGTTTMLTPTM